MLPIPTNPISIEEKMPWITDTCFTDRLLGSSPVPMEFVALARSLVERAPRSFHGRVFLQHQLDRATFIITVPDDDKSWDALVKNQVVNLSARHCSRIPELVRQCSLARGGKDPPDEDDVMNFCDSTLDAVAYGPQIVVNPFVVSEIDMDTSSDVALKSCLEDTFYKDTYETLALALQSIIQKSCEIPHWVLAVCEPILKVVIGGDGYWPGDDERSETEEEDMDVNEGEDEGEDEGGGRT
jgi:hypothetical protein